MSGASGGGGDAEARVESLLAQLNDAVHDLLRQNRQLRERCGHHHHQQQQQRRRRHQRSVSSGTNAAAAPAPSSGLLRSENRLINLFKSSSKARVQVWAPTSRLVGHRDGILDLHRSSADPDLLCSASADHTAFVWSAEANAAILRLKTHKGAVNTARFHQLKPVLLTASGDRCCGITAIKAAALTRRSSDTGTEEDLKRVRQQRRRQHQNRVSAEPSAPISVSRSLSWPALLPKPSSASPEAAVAEEEEEATAEAASVSRRGLSRPRTNSFPALGCARVLDTSACMCTGHADVVSGATWLGSTDKFISGSWDKQAIVWAVAAGSSHILCRLKAHEGRLTGVSSNAAGNNALTCSVDETFVRWDLRSPQTSVATFSGHTGPVNSAEFIKESPADLIASSSDDRTVQIWDSRVVKKPLVEIGCSSRVNRVCVSPSNAMLTLPADDGSLKTYNMNGDLVIRTPRNTYTGIVTCAVWSPDEAELYSGGWDLNVTAWRTPLEEQKQKLEQEPQQQQQHLEAYH